MKQKITTILLAVLLPAFLYAQSNSRFLDIISKGKEQFLKLKQKSLIHQSFSVQNQLAKQMSTYSTPYYKSTYSFDGGGYYSSSLKNVSEKALLRSFSSQGEMLSEGTMDDNGNWWGLVFNLFGDGENINGSSLKKNQNDGPIESDLIFKIDKSNGNIVKRIALSNEIPYLGMAFNPVDKLIYFTGVKNPEGNQNGSKLSKDVAVETTLFSLNPATYEILEVGHYEAILFGLACSNNGVFYSLDFSGAGSYPLIKFTAGSPELTQIGTGIETADFELFIFFIDMEMDRNADKCYLQTINVAEDLSSEFREINLNSGLTVPFYSDVLSGIALCGGLAFDETTIIAPPSSGKLVITSPNGGENLTGGKYQYITWTKSSGIIPGAIQLEYSTDGGVTWKKINTSPIAGVMRYSWLVPNNVNSSRCLVRMVNYLTRKEFDRSDRVFSINTTTASMAANFPNPFNPSTKIVFTISKSAQTSLRVYNALGQQVAELVNKQLESGVHEYEFNAANLPSGVYIYQLESDGVSEMHKMVLIK